MGYDVKLVQKRRFELCLLNCECFARGLYRDVRTQKHVECDASLRSWPTDGGRGTHRSCSLSTEIRKSDFLFRSKRSFVCSGDSNRWTNFCLICGSIDLVAVDNPVFQKLISCDAVLLDVSGWSSTTQLLRNANVLIEPGNSVVTADQSIDLSNWTSSLCETNCLLLTDTSARV